MSLNNAFERGKIALTNRLKYSLVSNLFQKKDLREDRRRVLSDEAKRLFRAEPGLLMAAENEFKSKLLYNIFISIRLQLCSNPIINIYYGFLCLVDLPPGARLDDLVSLLSLDAKNIDVEKLGIDAIKEQQQINLKFSSEQVAIIPEDRAQRMLAGVSHIIAFECG